MTKTKPNFKCLTGKSYDGKIMDLGEILTQYCDENICKANYEVLAERIDSLDALDIAIRLYEKTYSAYFLEKINLYLEHVLLEEKTETGVYEEFAQNIADMFDNQTSISESLQEWFENFKGLVMKCSVVLNCRCFIELILDLCKKHKFYISDFHKELLYMYIENNPEKLKTIFRKYMPVNSIQFLVRNRCPKHIGVKMAGWNDDDYGDYYDDDYDYNYNYNHNQEYASEEICEREECPILDAGRYFSASICLYKLWLDSSSNNVGSFDIGFEKHNEFLGYISNGMRIIEGCDCGNKTLKNLFTDQYKLFRETYAKAV